MRILIFTDAWEPQLNGVVRTLTTTVLNLKNKGHDVLVVSPKEFLCIQRKFTKWIYPDVTFCFPPLFKINSIIKKFKPDAIHISTEGPIGWSAALTCLIKQISFTTTYHTKFPEYLKTRFYIPLWFGYAYERLFHNRSARTMVATKSLHEELSSRGFKNLVFWERGVDTDIFHPSRRIHLYPGDHKPVALFFGRISKEKNITAFLDSQWQGTKYIIGDGPQLEYLKSRYPHTIFLGKKIGVELAEYIASADIVVFPSKTDTYGLTIIESMACGTPVAAFNVTGPKDIIINGQTGEIAYNDDLSQAMKLALFIDRSTCRKFAETKTWNVCTDQFINNLLEIHAV